MTDTTHAEVSTYGGALEIQPGQTRWEPEQVAALMAFCGLEDVPDGDAFAFLHLCQRSQLDPWAREIYLIGRNERRNGVTRTKYTAQTGIDGYRTIAERTGEYAGRVGPYWCGPDGKWVDVWLAEEPPSAARVGILRTGINEPFFGTVAYREYVPTKPLYVNDRKTGEEVPTAMWAKMPAHMLAKCAEALAIRTAFPRSVAGIYTDDEMAVASATQDAEEEAASRAERAKLRAELVRPAWGPGEAASPTVTAPGEVITAEIVTDRDVLWSELESQAQVLGQKIPAMTRRWVTAHKKNIDDATVEELAAYLESNRRRVEEKAREAVTAVVGEVAETLTIPEEPEPGSHKYQKWGTSGECVTCQGQPDDPRHVTP